MDQQPMFKRLPNYLFKNPLPEVAQESLKRAVSVESWEPTGCSKARTKALDAVIYEIKRRFPQFFKD